MSYLVITVKILFTVLTFSLESTVHKVPGSMLSAASYRCKKSPLGCRFTAFPAQLQQPPDAI